MLFQVGKSIGDVLLAHLEEFHSSFHSSLEESDTGETCEEDVRLSDFSELVYIHLVIKALKERKFDEIAEPYLKQMFEISYRNIVEFPEFIFHSAKRGTRSTRSFL